MAETAWANRIIGHDQLDPLKIASHPRNWRAHPDHQRAVVKGALSELGWIDEVIINATTGFLVNGHLRVALAIDAKQPTVPVSYVSLDEREEALALASFDAITALAQTEGQIYLDLTASLAPENAALAELLTSLRQQATYTLTVESVETASASADTDAAGGDLVGQAEADLVKLKVKVSPETYARYETRVYQCPGADESAKFAALVALIAAEDETDGDR